MENEDSSIENLMNFAGGESPAELEGQQLPPKRVRVSCVFPCVFHACFMHLFVDSLLAEVNEDPQFSLSGLDINAIKVSAVSSDRDLGFTATWKFDPNRE